MRASFLRPVWVSRRLSVLAETLRVLGAVAVPCSLIPSLCLWAGDDGDGVCSCESHFLSSTPTLIRYLGCPVYWLCWRTVDYINIGTPLSQQCSITGPVPRERWRRDGAMWLGREGNEPRPPLLLWPSVQQHATVTDFISCTFISTS